VIRSADNTQRIVTNNGNASNNLTSPRTQYNPIDESKMLGLPSKALYSMHFDPVPVNQISTLQGRIVKITNQQNEEIEGRIKAVSASSVVVEGDYENEIPIATIKQVLLMVKKANR
jgi:small nuclear ribonucleoprotein (snRNP)-like protein